MIDLGCGVGDLTFKVRFAFCLRSVTLLPLACIHWMPTRSFVLTSCTALLQLAAALPSSTVIGIDTSVPSHAISHRCMPSLFTCSLLSRPHGRWLCASVTR